MEELIGLINKTTGYRVEIYYCSYADCTEGYKARFYADENEMVEIFEKPLDAVLQLAENYKITL